MIRVDQRTVECGWGGGGNEPADLSAVHAPVPTQDPSHLLGGDGFTTSNCATFKLRGIDTLHPSDAQQWDSLDKSTGLRTRKCHCFNLHKKTMKRGLSGRGRVGGQNRRVSHSVNMR